MSEVIFIEAIVGVLTGAACVGFGVWFGYRIGFQSRTGDEPPRLVERQSFEGAIIDQAIYPDATIETD